MHVTQMLLPPLQPLVAMEREKWRHRSSSCVLCAASVCRMAHSSVSLPHAASPARDAHAAWSQSSAARVQVGAPVLLQVRPLPPPSWRGRGRGRRERAKRIRPLPPSRWTTHRRAATATRPSPSARSAQKAACVWRGQGSPVRLNMFPFLHSSPHTPHPVVSASVVRRERGVGIRHFARVVSAI